LICGEILFETTIARPYSDIVESL